MTNSFCHIELTTSNVDGAINFYKNIFDWKITKMTGMDYHGIDTGKPPGGGLMAQPSPQVPVCWTVYVEVSSVEDTLAKVETNKGHILVPKTEIPQIGWFGVFSDPQGGVLGIFESIKK
jgi:predicted enzyme related to lactoylglutathione lyase